MAMVLSPAIVYALVLIGLALKQRFLPALCPRCGKRGLETVNSIRSCGREGGDFWSYHLCRRCGARLKLHHDKWSDPTDEEWRQRMP